MHLSWLDENEILTRNFVSELPFLTYDLSTELARRKHWASASKYLELLRVLSPEPDSMVLLQLGKCYLGSGGQSAAEECFLAAIEADPEGIDARIELANMYELAREDEEALILAAEAMALRGARGGLNETMIDEMQQRSGESQPRRRAQRPVESAVRGGHLDSHRKPVIPRRYRPKRLGAPDQRRKEEQAHAIKLSRRYQTVCELRQRIRSGSDDLIDLWMQSSKELLEDFRSLKQFYSWEKYLEYLGSNNDLPPVMQGERGQELLDLYERLTRCKY